MTTLATTHAPLLSAEDFLKLPDNGELQELVRGRIVAMTLPPPIHGYYCGNVAGLLWNFVQERDLGRVVTNDSAILTEQDPDTLRGADVAYYSYKRLPKGPMPGGNLTVKPELVIEIRSPNDRWDIILAKVAEYLRAGVTVVCVLDPDSQTAHLFRGDQPNQVLEADQELTFPDILEGFHVLVRRLFQ